jgi:hypothetical protein
MLLTTDTIPTRFKCYSPQKLPQMESSATLHRCYHSWLQCTLTTDAVTAGFSATLTTDAVTAGFNATLTTDAVTASFSASLTTDGL